MNTLFLVVLLEYIGVPKDAAEIIALITYIIVCLLILGALISIINIGTYTKKANCIFRSVSAHKPFVLCMVSAETVHGERLNCAWIPRG